MMSSKTLTQLAEQQPGWPDQDPRDWPNPIKPIVDAAAAREWRVTRRGETLHLAAGPLRLVCCQADLALDTTMVADPADNLWHLRARLLAFAGESPGGKFLYLGGIGRYHRLGVDAPIGETEIPLSGWRGWRIRSGAIGWLSASDSTHHILAPQI